MFASEFMYDNCRVNIGYEHGDKRILEYNIQKIIRLYAASKIVNLECRNSYACWVAAPNPQSYRLATCWLRTHSSLACNVIDSQVTTRNF